MLHLSLALVLIWPSAPAGDSGRLAVEECIGEPLGPPDLFATIDQACGIRTDRRFFHRAGKLFLTTDHGRPILDLF